MKTTIYSFLFWLLSALFVIEANLSVVELFQSREDLGLVVSLLMALALLHSITLFKAGKLSFEVDDSKRSRTAKALMLLVIVGTLLGFSIYVLTGYLIEKSEPDFASIRFVSLNVNLLGLMVGINLSSKLVISGIVEPQSKKLQETN